MLITDRIAELGIIPVVKIEDADKAVLLAQALNNAHLTCVEIMFRTAAAAASIKAISDKYPELLIGAGTVLTRKQVDEATTAGAKFIVTPGFNPDTVAYCVERKIPIIPGCSSATDIEAALAFGLKVIKFFPAEPLGGLPMIKALSAPYGNIKFITTGGINEKNFRSYLDFPKVIAVAGSWMVLPELIDQGNFAEIERLSRKAIKSMLGFEIESIDLVDASLKEGASQWEEATDGLIRFNKETFNTNEIQLRTIDLKRAVIYLESLGLHKLENTMNDSELPKTALFKSPSTNFTFKLIQKN